MERVGVFDATTHLSQLVERASRGETIVITRDGRPMARLVPAGDAEVAGPTPPMTCDAAWAALREVRSRSNLGPGLTARDLIDDGRRH